MITLSKTFEWDMGHRVTNHDSLCKNPHGHRYKMIIDITGPIIEESGSAQEGMVIDFGRFKNLVNDRLVNDLDHAFMYWEDDKVMKSFAGEHTDLRMHAVPFVPTAECIAGHLAQKLQDILTTELPDLRLLAVQIFETPTSKATWSNDI